MKPVIIAIIGAPGVGKSFLTTKLAGFLNAEAILERIEEIPNRILDNLKNHTNQLETILWFRNKCIRNIEKALKLKAKNKTVIMDTCLLSNQLHVNALTDGFEQEILLKQAKTDEKYLPHPDIIIFLNASEVTIRKLTQTRNRDFDTNEKFLQRNLTIQKNHQEYYKLNKSSIIYINRDNLDFNKLNDKELMLEKIEEFLEK